MAREVVTQMGSLPFTDIMQAIDYSLRHDIPFLPELPKKGDAMLNYIKNPGTLSCLKEFKKNEFNLVKIQCVGPATLIQSGYSENDSVERCYTHIVEILNGLNADKIILFLDEPVLGQVGFDFTIMHEAIFKSFSVIRGIHVCGDMDWDRLFGADIDIISFNASKYDLTKYPKYRGGKRIAWGIRKREDVKDFESGDLLTLPCGMGGGEYEQEDCEEKLRNLNLVADTIT